MNSDFDSGLSPKLCPVMLELGYADLTRIQAQSIPMLLAGPSNGSLGATSCFT